MTKLKQIYKCNICGNITEVLHVGEGELVCCGQPMELMIEKKEEEGQEKHLPIMEKITTGVRIKVGSIAHPMEENHFIEWIEIIDGDNGCRKFLKPGDSPVAEFKTENNQNKNLKARIFCNIHGLWESEI